MASHDLDRKVGAEAHIARALAEDNVVPLEVGSPSLVARTHLPEQRDNDELSQIPSASIGPVPAASPVASPNASPLGDLGRFKRRPWRLALAASVAAAVVTAGSIGWMSLRPPTYTTAIGEQRSITLDDGSSVELNARSRIRVRFSEEQRSVDLLEGQALFRVAKDAARPFVVATDDTRVRAVGTQFDVNRRKSATTVTVIEGKVGVDSAVLGPAADPAEFASPTEPKVEQAREVFLVAGEQLTVTPTAIEQPKRANIAAATAWTQKRLVFDSAPLSEVAEEFNRYNKRPIVIKDGDLASFGVIGVFSSTDPASLLRFLRAQPEIEVIEQDAEVWIVTE